MALDEVKGLQGASDRPDDRDFHAEHILGAEPVEIPKYVNLNDLVPSHNQGASLHCFPSGTKITMADGQMFNIENVKIGDSVLDGYGEKRTVIKTYERQYEGDLIRIDAFRLRGDFKLFGTPEHKVRILREGQVIEEELQNIKPGEHLALTIPKITPISESIIDILAIADNAVEMEEGKVRVQNGEAVINRYIKLDEEFLYLCGLYLAEGYIQYINFEPHDVGLAFHTKEQHLRDVVRQALINIGIEEASIHEYSSGNKRGTCTTIKVHNCLLGKLFLYLFGKGAQTKGVSFEWLGLDKKLLQALLKGLFDGDGYITNRKTSNEIGLGLISPKIITFVFYAGLVLGIKPSIGKRNTSTRNQPREDVWEAYFYGQDAVDLLPDFNWEKPVIEYLKRARCFVQDGFYFVKVREVEEVKYSGNVYNLEVEGSHTYTANFCSVNNCTSYGLTHCIEILNTLEHNMKIVLNPEEQWQNQLNPPNEMALLPPADESVGDSLQHALRIFMRFGLKNEKNAVAVDRFQGLGYAAIQKTLEDYKRWITLKYPVYSGWLSHCFAIVGFDDAKQVLICKNSYGPNWGENRDGSFTIDYADIPRLFTGYIIYDKRDINMIFKDVSENSPMAKNIKKLRDLGIVKGYGGSENPEQNLFMPDKPVTRAEVCEMLGNLIDKLNLN